MIVLHLLLAPVGTVVKPTEHGVERHRSPLPVASPCFPQSFGLRIETTGFVGQRFDTIFSLCGHQRSGCRRSGWAHNLWEELVQDNCHALEEVLESSQWVKDVTASRGVRVGQESENGMQMLRVTCVKARDVRARW